MNPDVRRLAMKAKGWMPDDQGELLWRVAHDVLEEGDVAVEVGAYCGKSTLYLGDACKQKDAYLYSIDHHRGSPEHQPGQPFFDPELYFEPRNVIDTLPTWRANVTYANLEVNVIGVVGDSTLSSKAFANNSVKLLFIDGAHEEAMALSDYMAWAPALRYDGYLVLHDVDPGVGPYAVWKRAHHDGMHECAERGSLKVLTRP